MASDKRGIGSTEAVRRIQDYASQTGQLGGSIEPLWDEIRQLKGELRRERTIRKLHEHELERRVELMDRFLAEQWLGNRMYHSFGPFETKDDEPDA